MLVVIPQQQPLIWKLYPSNVMCGKTLGGHIVVHTCKTTNDQFISYFNLVINVLMHELFRIQCRKSMNWRLFSGMQNSYTPEHLCSILVITHVLGFAADLCDS